MRFNRYFHFLMNLYCCYFESDCPFIDKFQEVANYFILILYPLDINNNFLRTESFIAKYDIEYL